MRAILLTRLCLLFLLLSLSSHLLGQYGEIAYICPVPGSSNLNPEQNIIIRLNERLKPSSLRSGLLQIKGSVSGPFKADLLLADDDRTIIFTPTQAFALGETVHIMLREGINTVSGKEISSFEFEFSIIHHDRNAIRKRLEELSPQTIEDNYQPSGVYDRSTILDISLPPDFPAPTVYSYGPEDEQYIFVNLNCRNPYTPWNLFISILDSYGTPVFFEESELNRINFGPLPDGRLCYATNIVVNNEDEKYYILDSAYIITDSVNTGNGYILDAHDMLLLSNGHFLVLSYDPQPVNMSQIVPGGDPNAIVTGLVIQEVDNNQNVFFQWRSWDHFEITDATEDVDLTAPGVDYVHGNALEIDQDGQILLSSRHLDEITKINRNTGNLIWRFGLNSENNSFNILDDPEGFTHQHDIVVLPNGHYTVFDNGNLRTPQYSRVLEYAINENSMTADLVWAYNHSPNIYTSSAGSFRTQANGDRIIGWGGTFPDAITELKADNSLLREFYFPNYVNSYRAIKGSWETNLFTTQEVISLGNYAGNGGYKINYLYIYNQSDKVIEISSVHHHRSEFEILDNFPRLIFPNSYTFIKVGFLPQNEGEFSDRLTLNYDNADTSRRIARQLEIKGMFESITPSLLFDPAFGASDVSPDTEIKATFSEPVKKAFGGDINNEDIQGLFDLKLLNRNGESIAFAGIINDEKTEITLHPQESLAENKQYYVRLIGGMVCDYDGHIMMLDEETYFSTGISTEISFLTSEGIIFYPNPFIDKFRVSRLPAGEKLINVYASAGQLVKCIRTSEINLNIDLGDQDAGIYYVEIAVEESNRSETFKVFKSGGSR